jgi:hypothetical protein
MDDESEFVMGTTCGGKLTFCNLEGRFRFKLLHQQQSGSGTSEIMELFFDGSQRELFASALKNAIDDLKND